MADMAADDVCSIRKALEWESGARAAMGDQEREPPSGCLDRLAWFGGYDEVRDLKRGRGHET